MNWSFVCESSVCHSSYAKQLHAIDDVLFYQSAFEHVFMCVHLLLFIASFGFCTFSFIACVITTPSNNDPPQSEPAPCNVLSCGSISSASNSTSLRGNRRLRETKESNDQPPSKRLGRLSSFPNHICGQCILFSASGSNENLSKYHKMNFRTRHPLDEYAEFMIYASNNTPFSMAVERMSCICDACFRDFGRFKSLSIKNDFVPRWFKLKQEVLKQQILCYVL